MDEFYGEPPQARIRSRAVSVGGSRSVVVAPARPARKFLRILVVNAAPIWVQFGEAATAENGWYVTSGGVFEMNGVQCPEEVHVYSKNADGGAQVLVMEG